MIPVCLCVSVCISVYQCVSVLVHEQNLSCYCVVFSLMNLVTFPIRYARNLGVISLVLRFLYSHQRLWHQEASMPDNACMQGSVYMCHITIPVPRGHCLLPTTKCIQGT